MILKKRTSKILYLLTSFLWLAGAIILALGGYYIVSGIYALNMALNLFLAVKKK